MGWPQYGTKCTCTGCHQRFYDLHRSPVICPKCGVQQPPERPRIVQPPRGSFGTRFQRRASPAPVPVNDDVEAVDTVDVDAEADEAEADDDAGVDNDIDIDDDVDIDAGIKKPAD